MAQVKTVAVSLDHWTEIHTTSSYLGVMTHYIKNETYYTRNLAFELDEGKTATEISEQITEILDQWDIRFKVLFIVTDGASANRKAFVASEDCYQVANEEETAQMMADYDPLTDEYDQVTSLFETVELLDNGEVLEQVVTGLSSQWMKCH